MDYAKEQRQRWNGAAGHAWVASQAVLDLLFEPLADRLADLAAARRPDQLLDVGCGTGSTTVGIARRLGTTAACVGVDISGPMLAAARAGRPRRRGGDQQTAEDGCVDQCVDLGVYVLQAASAKTTRVLAARLAPRLASSSTRHAVPPANVSATVANVPSACAANCAVIVSAHDASGHTGQNCNRGILTGNREFWPVSSEA
jgi:SAM-dependent methyltransferase